MARPCETQWVAGFPDREHFKLASITTDPELLDDLLDGALGW